MLPVLHRKHGNLRKPPWFVAHKDQLESQDVCRNPQIVGTESIGVPARANYLDTYRMLSRDLRSTGFLVLQSRMRTDAKLVTPNLPAWFATSAPFPHSRKSRNENSIASNGTIRTASSSFSVVSNNHWPSLSS